MEENNTLPNRMTYWPFAKSIGSVRSTVACLLVLLATAQLGFCMIKAHSQSLSLEILPLVIDLTLYIIALLLAPRHAFISLMVILSISVSFLVALAAMASTQGAIAFSALVIVITLWGRHNT